MIEKLSLHNFKSYKDQEFEFRNLTVFCGNNSVGKSTAIQAISIPLQSAFSDEPLLNGELTEVGYIKDIQHKKASDDALKIELTIDGNCMAWGYDDFAQQKRKSTKQLSMIRPFATHVEPKLKELLSNFQYLQAERFGPRTNFELAKSNSFHQDWLGSKGEFTIEFLFNTETFGRVFVGQTFIAEGEKKDPRLHSSTENQSLHRNVDAWMGEISPGISVEAKVVEQASVAVNTFSQNSNDSMKPQNVGFGVSYVLSIVTALLHTKKGGLVVLENPEAHLHPRGQSYLGRLIALTSQAGVQVVVETHSDHIMNGIRLMTRLNKVDERNILFYQVFNHSSVSEVKKITVTSQGQFSEWPEGFFDQQVVDMKILLSGRE